MKPTLPTNYKDDILNTSVEGMRRYQMIYNPDNTVSFKDVTPYDQTGSDFGAGDINLTNQAVNQSADAGKIIDDPDTAEATTEEGYIAGVQLFNHVNDSLGGITQFVVDESTGKITGYKTEIGGADTVFPFSSGTPRKHPEILTKNNYQNVSIKNPKMAVLVYISGSVTPSIVISDKTIMYRNTNLEKNANMGFSYDATTDTLTLVDYESGGRQFELYYVN